MKKFKQNSAITLIALVITIIVLLILAGITLTFVLGENGLFSKARQAKEQTEIAQAEEDVNLRILEASTISNGAPTKENFIKVLTDASDEYLIEQDSTATLKNTGITTAQGLGSGDFYVTNLDKYPNIHVKVKNDLTIESSVASTTAGSSSSGSGNQGGSQAEPVTSGSNVTMVTVNTGETVPVPSGFYYVGGDLSNGVIISDNEADKYDGTTDKTAHSYRKSLQGNQFVWIPCDLNSYNFVTSYAKKTSANYGFDRIPGEISQIEKYSGFYVGRYEAGICMPTGTNNSGITTANILDGTSGSSWLCSDFTTTTGKPVVQAGAIPWYHANHSTASNVAENMYKGNSYVSSGLLTGTMWDQMIAKMGDGNTTTSGNYQNSTYTTEAGVYYSKTKNNGADGSNAWTNTSDSKSSGSRWITESGMLETYARYHIYDTAGNLWEWVEQVVSDSSSNVAFTLRGGGFFSDASTYPASYRDYDYASFTYTYGGFRVALYLK